MAVPILSRSQRRMEKKQALILLALVLGVSLISFTLGVMVGKGSEQAPVAAAPTPERLPVPPPQDPPATVPAPLTFYETLPSGEQPPLGSGINLPPKEKAAVKTVAPVTAPAPAPTPTPVKAAAAATASPAPTPVPGKGSAAAAGVKWLVQTASFQEVGEARKLQERLAVKGYAVLIQEADLGPKGKWYRVIVGPYPSQTDADQTAARLKSEEKLSALVRRG